MTEISITEDVDFFSVEAFGHSDSTDVCNAISTLLYTISAVIKNCEDIEEIAITLDPGEASIRFAGMEKARFLADFAKIGFLQLAENFPDFVSVDCIC